MPSISRIVTTLAILLAPIIAIGQSEPDWIRSLPEIPNCVAKITPITRAGKGFHQGANYERKKTEKDLANEAVPQDTVIAVDPMNYFGYPLDHCGSIVVAVNVPKLKERKPKFSIGPSPYRVRVLMRDMDAYLTRRPCDTIPCYDPYVDLEITFAKGRTLNLRLNRRFGDGVAYTRGIDFAKLNSAIDQYIAERSRK